MTPTTSTTLARLFGAGPSMLTDKEVRASLRDELERERAAADEAMREVIAAAEQRVTYLSPAIFDLPEKIGLRLVLARDALTRAKSDLQRAIIEGAIRQQEVELETALKLRAIRLPVSHTDPEQPAHHHPWEGMNMANPIVCCWWEADMRSNRSSTPVLSI